MRTTMMAGWLAMVLIGCGGGGGGGAGTLACEIRPTDGGLAVPAGSLCAEYSGSVIPSECPTSAGYVEVAACASSGRVARCDITTSTSAGDVRSALYFYAPNTVETARSACMAAGGALTEL